MTEPKTIHIRRAAVLGAGVMGAQIAAQLANARVPVLLYELAAEGDDPNANTRRAIQGLRKLEPAPVCVPERAAHIQPCNYDQHLALLGECDLVIEAIAERMDWKTDLYRKVAPHLGEHTIFATNTSGLSIETLAATLPESVRARFCGVHFFNPPRYMHLVELIPSAASERGLLEQLERFLVTTLGKGVIYAKDTPNFIANRVGVFSMLATMHHAGQFGLAPDLVDALTGPLVGRPKSATFRTADVVGLDTLGHVVHTMTENLADDSWHRHYQLPRWMAQLIESGALGQKTRRGVYRKDGKVINVIEPETGDYRPAGAEVEPTVMAILKERDPAKKFAGLRASDHPQGQFMWACFRDLFHYCAVHLDTIADNARDVDLAIRWGFGWRLGPFETWQLAGWGTVAGWIAQDIAAGKTLSDTPLPAWASEADRNGVYRPDGAFAPIDASYRPRSTLPVYRRQLFPERVIGEQADAGESVLETDAVRLWHTGDDIAVLSFKTKMHVVSDGVLDGIQQALREAEANFAGVVLWQPEEPFSAGANLAEFMEVVKQGDFSGAEQAVANFQQTSLRLRYSMVPTVAATRGLALGGGCEFLLHCDRVVAGLETYTGLVEAGVGLLPAGGGCKELAMRAVREAKSGDFFPFLERYFKTIAMAEVAKSAEQARDFGFLTDADTVVFNPHELLYVAKAQARALAETGYRPPLPPAGIPVAGENGVGTLKAMVVNLLAGGFISAHDAEIANRIAYVLCGGELPRGSVVDENWLLKLEREAFIELAQMPKTQERIAHTLKTGKPLRN